MVPYDASNGIKVCNDGANPRREIASWPLTNGARVVGQQQHKSDNTQMIFVSLALRDKGKGE
jgi:hypothetical protein